MKTKYAMMHLSMDRKDHATVKEIAKKISIFGIELEEYVKMCTGHSVPGMKLMSIGT